MPTFPVDGIKKMPIMHKISCHVRGNVITYAVCPVLFCSKLQTEISLSTIEAGYIALSQAMRKVIPFMSLMK